MPIVVDAAPAPTNDLVPSASMLDGLPGAPFTGPEVDAAVAGVRGAALWHIAPLKTETVTLDVIYAERRLRLPTRKLIAVTAVRDADDATVIDPGTYRVSHTRAQVVKRTGYWPAGDERVEVDIQHGYDSVPLDLLAVVAEAANLARREQAIRSVQIDDFQQQFGSVVAGALGNDETLNRYSLRGAPAYGLGIA